MACSEYSCLNVNCDFHDFTNDNLQVCPFCGGPLALTFDEYDDYGGLDDTKADTPDEYRESEASPF
jgi:hypothetical protein